MAQNPYTSPELGEPVWNLRPETFKFKYIDSDGKEVGHWKQKGEITEDALVLDGRRIPVLAIARTVLRMNRLVLVVATENEPVTLVIAILSGPQGGKEIAQELKREIDQATSSYWAIQRRDSLRGQGLAGTFRSERCRHCGSTIDLTGFSQTPQVYCHYCDAVTTLGDDAPQDEAHYHACDKCGFYSRPAVFVSTTIIFLIQFVYWRSQQHFMCHACMRGEAWKTVFRNVWTVVGVPMALCRLSVAYFGGSARSATFSGLDTGNQHARKLRLEKAEDCYQTILSRQPRAAGVHHNRALSRSLNGDWSGCLDAINETWADCANYAPALPLALKAYESLGRSAEAAALKTRWEQR